MRAPVEYLVNVAERMRNTLPIMARNTDAIPSA